MKEAWLPVLLTREASLLRWWFAVYLNGWFFLTGVLIYEMLVGYPPFFDDNPFGIYEKILAGKIEWTRFIDPIAKDLIKKLLVQDRTKRLGNMKVSMIHAVV